MADPFVIGVSSGAAVGAVVAIILGLPSTWMGIGALPVFAFVGGMLAIMTVYLISRTRGGVPVATLLLSGIAVSSFLSAVVSLLITFNHDEVGPIVYWLMGGLSATDWVRVKALLPYTVLGLLVLLMFTRELNLMLLGEESAQQLGVSVANVKLWLLVAGAVITAAAVSVSGIIGFVGLVVPHLIRLIWGPDYRLLMPASAIGGAVLLVLADMVARTVVAPGELPVGVITSMLGAPFFLYLLHRKRKEMF
jgi:iron complex transport system permease protein